MSKNLNFAPEISRGGQGRTRIGGATKKREISRTSWLRNLHHWVCGFYMMEQVRFCAVWPTVIWLESSMNHIQGWMSVWIWYSHALEKGCLFAFCSSRPKPRGTFQTRKENGNCEWEEGHFIPCGAMRAWMQRWFVLKCVRRNRRFNLLCRFVVPFN